MSDQYLEYRKTACKWCLVGAPLSLNAHRSSLIRTHASTLLTKGEVMECSAMDFNRWADANAAEITRLRAELDRVTEQRNNWADTVHAIAVNGLGLTDPLEQESGELPADWLPATGLLSDRVLQMREQLDRVTGERDALRGALREDALGEAIHVGFRKGCEAIQSHQIWSLIRDMPPDEWARYLGFVSWSLTQHITPAVTTTQPSAPLTCGRCLGGCEKCGQPNQDVPSVPRMPETEGPKCEPISWHRGSVRLAKCKNCGREDYAHPSRWQQACSGTGRAK